MTRILVAEDSPVNMALLADILEIAGHEVLEARNGKEAVEAAKAHKPDLILLDMMMPVMDGFEAAQRLKADPATKGIPVVALTALAMEGDERRVREAGCDAYVTKPIDTRALPLLLDQLLGRKPEAAVPANLLATLDHELSEGLEAIVAGLEQVQRRPNDHAAIKQVAHWAHRLRGGAVAVQLDDLARALGAIEETARRADAHGRLEGPPLEEVRTHLMQAYAIHERLRRDGAGA
ncbi:MAG TPA: response regulator [Candidatus Thermoplasmatota archaeon]|jgi:two-component system cell cycle response regulator DivK|nr:response regulator [Candidatus Thermoplasmatota archaeon]